jgi:hypothetical protein
MTAPTAIQARDRDGDECVGHAGPMTSVGGRVPLALNLAVMLAWIHASLLSPCWDRWGPTRSPKSQG